MSQNVDSRRSQLIIVLILGLITAAGLLLRLRGLGNFGFWWDELYHVLAAKSLLAEGNLHILMVGDYTRARPVTYLVALFFNLFGVSETAARLPFVLISTSFILVGFYIVRNWLNTPTAIIFALAMALSPFEIEMAREARMYAPFQLCFFVGVYLFYKGFEAENYGQTKFFTGIENKLGINVGYLFGSLLAFGISLSLHELTLAFSAALLSYCLIIATYNLLFNQQALSWINKYNLVIALALVLIGIFLVIDNGWIIKIFNKAVGTPDWWNEARDWQLYASFFTSNYPLIFYSYPLAAIMLIYQFGKKGLFIVAMFTTLIIIHSFVFGRKLERYIFYIYPYLMLAGSFFVAKLCQLTLAYFQSRTKASKNLAYIGIAVLCIMMSIPWMPASVNAYKQFSWQHWKYFPVELKVQLQTGDIATTRVMAVNHYLELTPKWAIRANDDEYDFVEDPKYGTRQIKDIEDLKTVFEQHAGNRPIFFVFSPWTFYEDSTVTPEMRQFLQENTEIVDNLGYKYVLILKKTAHH